MLVLYLILTGIHLYCLVTVVVSTFRENAGCGVAFIFLSLCFGVGVWFAFLFGWMNAKEWQMRPLMITWSIAWGATIGLAIIAKTYA